MKNDKKKRPMDYNCGGYALETYDWYHPSDEMWFDYGMDEMDEETMLRQTQQCVDYMLRQFKGLLRVIKGTWELQEQEYMIAFKIDAGGENDFHYMKRGKNGHWTHKLGGLRVERIKREKVFKDCWVFDDITYYGKTVFFAMKR